MKKIIFEVYSFIKEPNDRRIDNYTFRKNAKYLFVILVFELLIIGLIYHPIINLLDKVEPILYETRIDYDINTLFFTILFVSVIVPIIEEFIFRYLLRYNKFFSKIISRKNWDFIFKILVYTSIFIFGSIHGANFENDSIFFYCVLPILIFPQFIGGIFLTFLRVRFNFLSSVIYHILWNGLFSIIPIFDKPYERTTESYDLKIEYVNYNTQDGQKFQIDSISNKIFKVDIEEYSFNHILDSLYQYDRKRDDELLNIKLKSPKGLTKEELKNILLEFDKNELQ